MLFPVTYRVGPRGMEVGGCPLVDLAREHGTPLYVYDEETIRQRAREFRAAAGDAVDVLYSAKAFASPAFLRVVAEEGLGLDVVSAGELHFARLAAFPMARVYMLGNSKSRADVAAAHAAGVTLVIDGFHEFDLLREVVPAGSRLRCELRLSPGIQPETHDFISTGQLDSKFGFSVESGAAREAVERALAHDRIDLVGLHSHIGSQIFDLRGHEAAMAIMLDFVAGIRSNLGWTPQRLGAGGLGIAYTRADDPPTPREFVATLSAALEAGCSARGLERPRLVVEPGRSLAGPAAVALYTVGSIKEIPKVRTYAAVDGGMGDNIRAKLYGARYEVFRADRPEPAPEEMRTYTIAGRYCESTDVLVTDAELAELRTGDIVAMPAAGAYQVAMASQYNGVPRPAVVMVKEGRSRLIRRRETLDDLVAAEVF